MVGYRKKLPKVSRLVTYVILLQIDLKAIYARVFTQELNTTLQSVAFVSKVKAT